MKTHCCLLAHCLFTCCLMSTISEARAQDAMKLTPTTIPGVNEALQVLIDQGELAGAVGLVIQDGKVRHYSAVGLANRDKNEPMRLDNVFQIASMTKPMASTAVLMACESGKLKLDDPISLYIPAFKDSESDPTIRQLLTHTSGLQEPEGVEFFNGLSLEEYAARVAKSPRSFKPGENWRYGIGISIAGRALEVVEKKTFAQILEEKLLNPLGMRETTFSPNEELKKRIAAMYGPGEAPGALSAKPTPALENAQGKPYPNPSGGLFSTAADLARFYTMIWQGGTWGDKQLVSKSSIEQMRTIQTGEFVTGFSPGNGWGLGWCVVKKPQDVTEMLNPGTFGHGGAWGTQGWIDSVSNTIFVLLLQRTGFEHNSDDSNVRKVFQQKVVEGLKSNQ